MEIIFNLKSEQILLRADALNYEICKIRSRTDEKTGTVTEEWAPYKFFASLPQALNRVLDLKVRASDATSIKELAIDLESARKEIMSAWSTEAIKK